MAVIELAAHAAANPYGKPRAMLLAAGDYSAVSWPPASVPPP